MYAGFTPAVLCLSFFIPTGTDETNLTESRYYSVREQNLSVFPGIYSVAASHQAEPGRTSRPVSSLFFCLAARDWSGIYFVAAAPKRKAIFVAVSFFSEYRAIDP